MFNRRPLMLILRLNRLLLSNDWFYLRIIHLTLFAKLFNFLYLLDHLLRHLFNHLGNLIC